MSQTPVDIESQSQYIDEASTVDDEPIILNVGGIKYEVRPTTLTRYPQTLLGNMFLPENKHLRRPDKKGEYFFDRNGRVFEVILNFYRTGKLVIPTEIPQELIKEELKYFKLDYENQENEENEDEKIMKLPRDQIFNFANSLIHSSSKYEIKRGLYFLQKLSELEPNSYLYKYSIAFAYYRLKKNIEGVEVLEELLKTDPHNPQVRSLLTLFNDNRTYNAKVGLVAVSILVVGIFGFWKLRSWWRAAVPAITSSAATVVSNSGSSGNIQVVGEVIRSAANTPSISPVSVSNAVAHTVASVIPSAATAGKVIANHNDTLVEVATAAVNNAANTVVEVATTTLPTTATTTAASVIAQSSFLEAMNQSLPTPDQFVRN